MNNKDKRTMTTQRKKQQTIKFSPKFKQKMKAQKFLQELHDTKKFSSMHPPSTTPQLFLWAVC